MATSTLPHFNACLGLIAHALSPNSLAFNTGSPTVLDAASFALGLLTRLRNILPEDLSLRPAEAEQLQEWAKTLPRRSIEKQESEACLIPLHQAPRRFSASQLPLATGSVAVIHRCVLKTPAYTKMETDGKVLTNKRDAERCHDREVRAYKAFGTHPNIVTFLGDLPSIGFVMEYIDNGTLENYLNPRTSSDTLRAWYRGTFAALEHIHSMGFAVCDLSPGNILISQLDRDGPTVAKLCDFGHCIRAGEVVSPGWDGFTAPEIGAEPLSQPELTDVYSLGAILGCMLRRSPKARKLGDDAGNVCERGEVPDCAAKVLAAKMTALLPRRPALDACNDPGEEGWFGR